ncbi:60S ribosomal protein L26, partial [Candidatus Nitrosotalea sp. FS]|uniref:60S ribosomal protein L26 n=1 Tax=Candidatus Nitrosotalea sp. FS TaxID=2341021 RepID=UPI00140B18CA
VSTEKRGIAIEGIKREKLKGGNVDIYIHPSNVIITSLNLEDKWRQSRLEGQKPQAAKSAPQETKETKQKESKPKEQKEASKEKPKETKKESKPDDTKDKSKTEKKGNK